MTEELNLSWAREAPDVQEASPDVTPVTERTVLKVIPNQLWSMVQAMSFVDLYAAGLRDPERLAAALADGLAPAVDLADGNQETLDAEHAVSSERRTALGLSAIDASTYAQQRDPRLLDKLVLSLLNVSGLESELTDDLEQATPDASLVGISDSGVQEAARSGAVSAQEARAREIAAKLGLTPASDDGWHAIIPEVVSIDSTDPYIKKVVG